MAEKLVTLSNLATFKSKIEQMISSGGGGSSSNLPSTTPTIVLESDSITLAFDSGVLPTHIKLSNGTIIDLQGNEYCAEGEETVTQSIYNDGIVIIVSGDFSELSSVTMTNLVWCPIQSPSNFSFDDLPRWSIDGDIEVGGGGQGGGSSSSGDKTYLITTKFSINSTANNIVCIKNLIKKSQLDQLISSLNSALDAMSDNGSYNLQHLSSFDASQLNNVINSVRSEINSGTTTVVFGKIMYSLFMHDSMVDFFLDKTTNQTLLHFTMGVLANDEHYVYGINYLTTGSNLEAVWGTSNVDGSTCSVSSVTTQEISATAVSSGSSESQQQGSGFVKIALTDVFAAPTYMYLEPSKFAEFCQTASSMFGAPITKDNLPDVWGVAGDYEKKSALMLISFYTTFTNYDGNNALKWDFDTMDNGGQTIATECYLVMPVVGNNVSGNIYSMNCSKVSANSDLSSTTITIS